ncbi:MAG TPA: LPS export ABC transporter periplasmic protein LptC, partial [Candidatus Obscuribacterales bacterium]|nr:LPS export ABC transporter periplasmic protein LptC [Candidatus Obscuribacterales bacterium]
KIFSKNTLKFVAALSIPAGLTYFWYYSNEQARIEMESYKKEQKENPLQDRVSIDNYELKEVDDQNNLRWQLTAKSGTMLTATKDVNLTEVVVVYYKDKQVKMRLTAPSGVANEGSRKVMLDSNKTTRVVAEGEPGKGRMESSKLELTKKNQFTATGGVNIDMPGVAKVTGNQAVGEFAKGGIRNVRVIGNTHSIVNI